MPILAKVDRHYFAPKQQALHQHPAEGGHEEEMQQGCHQCAGHLGVTGSEGHRRVWGQRSVTRSKHKHMEHVKVLTTHDENGGEGKGQHNPTHTSISGSGPKWDYRQMTKSSDYMVQYMKVIDLIRGNIF